MLVDLHSHTTKSDGTFTPKELLDRAKEKGLKVISITDHDCVDGLDEANVYAKEIGLELVNGIEFSTEYLENEIHILGYFIDYKNEKLKDLLYELKNERLIRAKKIIEKLAKYKVIITMDDILKHVEKDLISRSHIANAIMDKGYCYDKGDVFKQYLGIHGVAYIPKKVLTPVEAVKIIKEVGGVASLAHPKYIELGGEKMRNFIEILKGAGLDAIECNYPSFSDTETKWFTELAEEYQLLITGGSDFHGGNRAGVELGDAGLTIEQFNKLKDLL